MILNNRLYVLHVLATETNMLLKILGTKLEIFANIKDVQYFICRIDQWVKFYHKVESKLSVWFLIIKSYFSIVL